MSATNELLSVLEKCQISPPPNTVGERSLQLTFFDLAFLPFPPVHQLFFYELTNSKAHFIQTTIPTLKHSLSITLQHFFPFAGNLILFPSPKDSNAAARKPEIRHVDGDSVQVTFAESDLDFSDLKGNHPRDCDKFYGLVPVLGDATELSDYVKIPLFAVQVTLFPNSGFTIGITNHHTLCDASSKFDFLKAWTSTSKYGTDELFLASGSLPLYDRLIKYPSSLDEIYMNLPGFGTVATSYKPSQLVRDGDKVRATIVFTGTQINQLKKWVSSELPNLEYVSSFSVVCAHVWACIAKSRSHVGEKKGEDELEIYHCPVDWRTRMEHPVPQSYFGNCVGACIATTKSSLLSATNGYLTAVEEIGKAIHETLKNKEGLMKDAETWFQKFNEGLPTTGVAGTPKLKVYDLDFGWGKPTKYEVISIEYAGSISVTAGKESPQDIEVGLYLPAKQMDAFIAICGNELESVFSRQEV